MKNLFWILLVIVGCSPKVVVTVQADFDFPVNKYPSYSWKDSVPPNEDKGNTYYPPVTDRQIHRAVDAVMEAKGYQLVDSGGELQLHYHIIIEDKTVETTETYDYESSTYWFRDALDPYYYSEGTLIIDIVDIRNECLIWRSRAIGILDDFPSDQFSDLNKIVAKMLKRLPVSNSGKVSVSKGSIENK